MPVLDVVAVLDVRLLEASDITREFVERALAARRLRGDGLTPECKALVVTREGAVYASGISVATLARRMTYRRQSTRAWEAET